jgi:hypothetical protein
MTPRRPRGIAPFRVSAVLLAAAFVLAGCGGGSGSEGTGKDASTTSTSSTPTVKKDPGSGPFCDKYQALQGELEGLIVQGGSSSQARFELAVRGMKELEGLATGPVKDALRTTIAAYEQVGPALAAAGYDASKLTPDQRAPLDSPDTAAASQALSAYTSTNCPPPTTTTTGSAP